VSGTVAVSSGGVVDGSGALVELCSVTVAADAATGSAVGAVAGVVASLMVCASGADRVVAWVASEASDVGADVVSVVAVVAGDVSVGTVVSGADTVSV